MLRVTLRGLQGHFLRFLLTASAVMLGVSFVTGTFVLRDSMDASLQNLFSQAFKGTDVAVRGAIVAAAPSSGSVVVDPTGASSTTRPGVPLTLEKTLAAVPGVTRVIPNIQGTAIIAGKDGLAVRTGGAPGLGFAFHADDPSFTLIKGSAPTGPSEVVVESSTLAKAQLAVGDRTTAVIGDQTRSVTISGEAEFGSLFGATAILVDEATARLAFAPDGTVPSISLTAAPGVSQEALRSAVAKALPATAEAVTGDTLAQEGQTSLQSGLGFFTTFMLVFAGVALFVGSFIIVNTFSMVVAQRIRELALLRAIGASRAQVLRVVLGEAAVVGAVGSLLGVGLGVVIAAGAKALIRSFLGADLGTGLPISVSTVLWSVAVGTIVTVAAATLPAVRAARTPPVTAMVMDVSIAPAGLRRRGWSGAVLLAISAGLLVASVTRTDVLWVPAGLGAALAVLGVLVAAPVATRPVVRVLAWPFVAVSGVVGKLARENTLRVARRTATTASALMIGLALIAGISVLASSAKASITQEVSVGLTSNFVLTGGGSPIPQTVATAAARLPHVQSASALSAVGVQIGTFSTAATATTATGLADNFLVTMVRGRTDSLAGRSILIDESTATANSWHVGDTLPATVGALTHQSLTVGGIFADTAGFSSHLIVDRSLYLASVPASSQVDTGVYVRADPGTDLAAVRASLVGLVKPFLIVSVQDGQEFADAQGASIDTILNLLYVLLLFSVIVAVLGIVNTLALSVFERTREIGLLRAIGLRRRQLAGMITVEAITTAVFGAVLGTVLGLGLGIALQHGLQSQGLSVLAIPWSLIVTMLVASAVVGVVAAVLPSIRAVRLSILTAIASS
ncbi:MAG: FtsX-like permease family protein [Lapillicoccus sp.]